MNEAEGNDTVTALIPTTEAAPNPADEQYADLIEALAGHGVSDIVLAPLPTSAPVTGSVDVLSALASAQPAPIVVAADPTGAEIAGRLAVRLNSGYLADVTGLNPSTPDGYTARGSIFGGVYEVSTAVAGYSPIVALRPGAVAPIARPVTPQVRIHSSTAATPHVTVTSYTAPVTQARPNLAQANVVIGGGRGIGSAEGFTSVVEPLADLLGGAVGVTRDVVDEGWYSGTYQIGQTGVNISPDLYINLGISGAIHHTVGIVTSGTIVTINNDEDAEIFDITDFGVVGDVHEIVPALIAELSARGVGAAA